MNPAQAELPPFVAQGDPSAVPMSAWLALATLVMLELALLTDRELLVLLTDPHARLNQHFGCQISMCRQAEPFGPLRRKFFDRLRPSHAKIVSRGMNRIRSWDFY